MSGAYWQKEKKKYNENECRWNVKKEKSHPQRSIARVDFIFLFFSPSIVFVIPRLAGAFSVAHEVQGRTIRSRDLNDNPRLEDIDQFTCVLVGRNVAIGSTTLNSSSELH